MRIDGATSEKAMPDGMNHVTYTPEQYTGMTNYHIGQRRTTWDHIGAHRTTSDHMGLHRATSDHMGLHGTTTLDFQK